MHLGNALSLDQKSSVYNFMYYKPRGDRSLILFLSRSQGLIVIFFLSEKNCVP